MPEFTSYAHGTPCWVDVTSPELDKSIEFYKGLFGWEAEATQPETNTRRPARTTLVKWLMGSGIPGTRISSRRPIPSMATSPRSSATS